MRVADGIMTMRRVEDGIELPAGGSITLAPGGYHLMFMGLRDVLTEGTALPVTLMFENAGEIEVSLPVLGIGASGAPDDRPARQEGMAQ